MMAWVKILCRECNEVVSSVHVPEYAVSLLDQCGDSGYLCAGRGLRAVFPVQLRLQVTRLCNVVGRVGAVVTGMAVPLVENGSSVWSFSPDRVWARN
jgi:hypothetical protein